MGFNRIDTGARAAPGADGASHDGACGSIGVAPWAAMRGISRSFGSVQACVHVDLDLRRSEVLALLGENGAGKSTLMAILGGVQQPDEGGIYVEGRPVAFGSPRAALAMGIGMVHQHFRLFEGLTVAENLFVGWKGAPVVNGGRRSLLAHARRLCESFGMEIDLGAQIWQLSVGEKQRVEILRMLIRDVNLLILDEPTAVLTPPESEQLFDLMAGLKEQGKGVVFISHKLNEVLQVADRIAVMRAGEKVAELPRAEADLRTISRLMFGVDLARAEVKRRVGGETVLSVEGLEALDDRRGRALRGLELSVGAGEIVGIAGVAGNGQRELTEVLSGMRPRTGGRVEVAGSEIRRANPREVVRAGLGIVPEERKGTGLAPDLSIWENAILRHYREAPIAKGGLLSKRAAKHFARALSARVKLSTADMEVPVGHLSGGHAQRLLVGREMEVARRALVLAYPSRGLDIAAIEQIRASAVKARETGMGILLISEDLDEIFDLSDRIAVLFEGRVVGEFAAADAERSAVGELMAGVGVKDEGARLGGD
jgi:ABC-type uncharacterized transport system ATPase subunit